MLHLKTAAATSERSDIETRLLGRFYTPLGLAESLAEAGAAFSAPERICDPFCGDGRLVTAWLRHLAANSSIQHLKKVSLWDFDEEAVAIASESVKAELYRCGAIGVVIDPQAGDSFCNSQGETYDLVVTNPPWEQLKPDARDLVMDADRYRKEIRSYAARLAEDFPGAGTSRRRSIGGYTVNLARAGALLAAKILTRNGLLQIVLPSSIFGDQVSEGFRREFFSKIEIEKLDFYPSEAKLFSGVDQGVVTLTGRAGKSSEIFDIRRFRPDLTLEDSRKHHSISLEDPLPLSIGGAQNEIVEWIGSKHPKLTWLESDLRFGLKLGRELDETRIAKAFTTDQTGVPFLKGRNISRFGSIPADLPLIDPNLRKIPQSVDQARVVWRDVSRPSQKRRVHSCIVPPRIVTGNSLGVARFFSPLPNLLETLAAVLNSLVFEAQIRAILATNHVSQGAIRRCVVSYSIFEDQAFRSFIAQLVQTPSEANEVQLEIALAKAHGLTRNQFATLLGIFDKLTDDERDILLKKDAWS